MKNLRIKNFVVFLILLLIEVLIGLFVHDTIIRPYVGDILVVIVIYFAVRILYPKGIRLLPIYIFIFASLVEVLQLFNLVEKLGFGDNRFMRTLLGSTFDIQDLLCYFVGCLILGCYEYFKFKSRKNKTCH